MEDTVDLNKKTLLTSNQDKLLSANNKFADQSVSELAAFSPPKFNIPLLKIPGSNILPNMNVDHQNSNAQSIPSNYPSEQLNKFILKQLQEKHTNNDLTEKNTGFVLPKLQSCDKTTVKFELPVLKVQARSTNMNCLTAAIDKLKLQENLSDDNIKSIPPAPVTIDLTTALAIKFGTHQSTPPTKALIKPQQRCPELDFEIPFIDCDRLDLSEKHKILVPASNKYCVTDVSQLLLHHSLAEPSAIGRFLSIGDIKYLDPLPLKYMAPQFHIQKVKHNIEPFNFDTKSPDDLVLLSLSKNQRRHLH